MSHLHLTQDVVVFCSTLFLNGNREN